MSQPMITYLLEIRTRLLKSVSCVGFIFLSLVYFANDLYTYVATPLLVALPSDAHMIAIDVTSPLFAPFQVTLVISFFISLPFLFYQLWAFFMPALYLQEKRVMAGILCSSTLLFYVGVVFSYFVALPAIFDFFTSIVPTQVHLATDITRYLNFVMKIFIGFGIAFEVPVAIFIACSIGITDAVSLKKKRPYFIVGAFVFAMLLTPPDVISQLLLALPMLGLFEIGVFLAAVTQNKPT